MIRRSAVIAATALLVSLLVHLAGLSLTGRDPAQPSSGESGRDVVALGNSFEEIAEAVNEPVAPAAAPEPPVEAQPEPEPVEPPTTKALVASENPQDVLSPDLGEADVPRPDQIEPVDPEDSGAPAPAVGAPDGDSATASGAQPATPPVETVTADPVEPEQAPVSEPAAESAASPPVSAAPVPTAPQPPATAPIAQSPEIASIPVLPAQTETVTPAPPEATVVPESEADATADGASELAVASSPRPQAAPQRPQVGAAPQRVDSLGFASDGDSPLARIMRGEADYSIFDNSRQTGSGAGGSSARGPGNSDRTNYAGRVLMHLNRAPSVTVYTPGVARVAFEINRDGTLAWVDVTRSTGTHEFDTAARQQVRNASPFPPPPTGAQRRFSFVFRSN